MLRSHRDAKVCGFDSRVAGVTHPLADKDAIQLGRLCVRAWHTPCHTTGSICYAVFEDTDAKYPAALFTGDTLFLGGCGRFFEGTASDMWSNFKRFKESIGPDTLLFVGHEYTVRNLEFAQSILPNDQQIADRLASLRAHSKEYGTWSEELATNIFLRADDPAVQAALKQTSPISTLERLRAMKNQF